MEFNLKRGIFNKVCTQIETEAIMKMYSTFRRNNKLQKILEYIVSIYNIMKNNKRKKEAKHVRNK